MKQSLSYYIILLVLKLKGIKKDFSKDPVDFIKVRKEDVHHPKGKFFKNDRVRNFKIAKTTITEVNQIETTDQLLIYIHGGAFISGPGQHHWDAIKKFHKQTDQVIWMCDYPKAPEHEIVEISENIDQVYEKALETYAGKQITLIGDSVGGTLITALVQRLIEKTIDLPRKIILISPVMDSTISNPDIAAFDKVDPMLSIKGIRSAKKMCAGNTDLNNAMISPLNGSFVNFPRTILLIASHDITCPDQQLTAQKLRVAKIDLKLIEGEKMPHVWPLLPVMKESKNAFKAIVRELNT